MLPLVLGTIMAFRASDILVNEGRPVSVKFAHQLARPIISQGLSRDCGQQLVEFQYAGFRLEGNNCKVSLRARHKNHQLTQQAFAISNGDTVFGEGEFVFIPVEVAQLLLNSTFDELLFKEERLQEGKLPFYESVWVQQLPANSSIWACFFMGMLNHSSGYVSRPFEFYLSSSINTIVLSEQAYHVVVTSVCYNGSQRCFKNVSPFLVYLKTSSGTLEVWIDPDHLWVGGNVTVLPLSALNNFQRLRRKGESFQLVSGSSRGWLGWSLMFLGLGVMWVACRNEIQFIDKMSRVFLKNVILEDERYRIQLHILELS